MNYDLYEFSKRRKFLRASTKKKISRSLKRKKRVRPPRSRAESIGQGVISGVKRGIAGGVLYSLLLDSRNAKPEETRIDRLKYTLRKGAKGGVKGAETGAIIGAIHGASTYSPRYRR
jgi:hypothetical protein